MSDDILHEAHGHVRLVTPNHPASSTRRAKIPGRTDAPRKTLIGRGHDPYNRMSASGQCSEGVRACEACRAVLEAGSVRSHTFTAVRAVRTVGRSVR